MDKRGENKLREEGHMKMDAEIEMIQLQAVKPEAIRKWKRQGMILP